MESAQDLLILHMNKFKLSVIAALCWSLRVRVRMPYFLPQTLAPTFASCVALIKPLSYSLTRFPHV